MNAFTVCLLAVVVAVATAQTGPFCHTCELMINDVKANHPNGFNDVSVPQLEAEMYAECDKYVPTPAFQDQICHSIIKNNEVKLLDALKQGVPSLTCCQAVNLCS